MSVILFPHNQIAYRNAVKTMQEEGRAAVVHPTGTGKSFIAFKLAEEHPGKKICWLAPSEYIFRSQKENYLEAGGEEEALSGITFLTYAKLMYSMTEEEDNTGLWEAVKPKNAVKQCDSVKLGDAEKERDAAQEALSATDPPDYIILDEFHRCGAESWGRSVETLLETFPKAEVLGLSATHIRFLDSRRDMAQELFGGHVASKMELAEAMAEGILPTPLYVCGLYEYKGELQKLSHRVYSQRSAGMRNEGTRLLEKLRYSLQDADGPREIFRRYMKKDGKYIVFCCGREHMEKMVSLAGEWFGALDQKPTIYRAVYDSQESPEEVRRFSADRSGHLKLLFCIDMLNEGIHVADVDGAVLLRPTASPTLYLQQIGRALSVPDKRKHRDQDSETEQTSEPEHTGQPIIFDLVDNFDSLRCIDSFLEAYHRAADADGSGQKKEKPQYRFRLIDEVRESRRIFDRLCRCLASSWETCFREAEKYYVEHGNLKIPKRYVTKDGIALGSWILTQRRVRAGAVPGNLSEEQVARLDAIGMDWEGRTGKAWERGYQELTNFHAENGHADVPTRYVTEDGYPLGKFVSNQRAAWKNTVRARKAGVGGNPCAAGNGTAQTGRILTAEQESRLDALGFIWEKTGQSWERYYSAAKAYFEKEGNLNVPVKYVTEDGLRLGVWLQEKSAGRKSLSGEKVRALDEIGMTWGSRYDAKWEEKYNLAKQFYREHGNLEIPKDYQAGGVMLGRWVSGLRSARKHPEGSHYRLDEGRIRQMDAIGMRWTDDSWQERYRLAESYYREHGNLKVSQAYVAEAGGKRIWLGKWLAEQRRKHNNPSGKRALTGEQTRQLQAIGMEW